jgi:hypothetical protein
MFDHKPCPKIKHDIKHDIKYDVNLLVGIFLNNVNLLMGPCFIRSGFLHETLNTPPLSFIQFPHQTLSNFLVFLHTFFFFCPT